jgi:glutamate--cysteine ligase
VLSVHPWEAVIDLSANPDTHTDLAIAGPDRSGSVDSDGRRLSELEAERHIGTVCFKTGPPGVLGTELEWLVCDESNPSAPVPFDRVNEILNRLKDAGSMPKAGLLTLEPGGQVELSSAPANDLASCVAAASEEMGVLRQAFAADGLTLTGHGLDLHRPPSRVLELPRYAAMEKFFDRRGPWGRLMMCSTASVQVCIDAGLDDRSASGYQFRWRLMHALGPVLVAAFANSPLREGKPTGWKCTRQLVWSRLDPYRTKAPNGAEPSWPVRAGPHQSDADPRQDLIGYAMDAEVLCLRNPDGQPWTVPSGLTFRDWLRGARLNGSALPGPTSDDLSYHLTTLFPPVRARGHLELRMIDQQPGDGWIIPVALVAALADDPVAADAAMAATEPVWCATRVPAQRRGEADEPGPWLRAARCGPSDPVIAKAVTACFAAADASLARSGAPKALRTAVTDFAERYPRRNRCPADDILDIVGTRNNGSGESRS